MQLLHVNCNVLTVSDDDQEQDSGYRGQERRLSDDFPRNSSGIASTVTLLV